MALSFCLSFSFCTRILSNSSSAFFLFCSSICFLASFLPPEFVCPLQFSDWAAEPFYLCFWVHFLCHLLGHFVVDQYGIFDLFLSWLALDKISIRDILFKFFLLINILLNVWKRGWCSPFPVFFFKWHK
jgi:hypothetical protein